MIPQPEVTFRMNNDFLDGYNIFYLTVRVKLPNQSLPEVFGCRISIRSDINYSTHFYESILSRYLKQLFDIIKEETGLELAN